MDKKQKKTIAIVLLGIALILLVFVSSRQSEPDSPSQIAEAGQEVAEPAEKKKTNKAVWIALMACGMGSGVAIFSATSAKRKKDNDENTDDT
jgi:flagellar basal body-associated protein FliL